MFQITESVTITTKSGFTTVRALLGGLYNISVKQTGSINISIFYTRPDGAATSSVLSDRWGNMLNAISDGNYQAYIPSGMVCTVSAISTAGKVTFARLPVIAKGRY